MSKKIKIGVVGLGRIGLYTAKEEIAKYPELYEIVACCDLIESRCNKMKEIFNCKTYLDIEEFIRDGGADLIYIATRSNDHFAHAMLAKKYGKNVVLEKPVTVSYEEALELYANFNGENQPKLYVHQQRRLENAFIEAMKIINSGKLGNIFEINTEQNGFQHRDDWQTLLEFGGGQLLNWGPHIIDQSLQFLGTPTFDVQSYLHQVTAGGDCEDHLRIRFIGNNNRVVNMCISGATELKKGRYYEVYGDRGALLISNGKLQLKYIKEDIEVPETISSPATPGEGFGASGTYESKIKIEWVEEQREIEMEDLQIRHTYWKILHDSFTTGKEFIVTQNDILAIMRTISIVKAQNKKIMKVK